MKKTITIQLKAPLSTIVDIKDGMSTGDILKVAEKQIVKQLEKEFPKAYTYGLADGDVLTPDQAKVGKIVVNPDNGLAGVIIAVNAKNIQVALKNGVLTGSPQCFKADPDKSSKDIQWARNKEQKSLDYWKTGDLGYIVLKDGPAKVVLNESRGKYKCICVEKEGHTAGPLTEAQIKGNLFDTLKEAKETYELRQQRK